MVTHTDEEVAAKRADARSRRFHGRHALRRLTTVRRCFDCGRSMLGSAVELRYSDGRAAFAGLETCGRVWLCPVCNSKVMARRALEVGAALAWAESQGLLVIWGALTLHHVAGSDLATLLQQQRDAWRFVVNSRGWRSHSATRQVGHTHLDTCADGPACERSRDVIDTGAAGRVGYIRPAELTIGPNGWHPHLHPIVFFRGSRKQAAAAATRLRTSWVAGVRAAGGHAADNDAQYMAVLDSVDAFRQLSGYVTKATYDASSLALEAVWSQGKTRAHGAALRTRDKGTEAHWALLAEYAEGDYTREHRWVELEAAITGQRMIAWSRGLRSFVGLGVEIEDDTLAAETLGGPEDSVCFIGADGWAVLRDEPGLIALVLSTQEREGWSATARLLDMLGVPFSTDPAASVAAAAVTYEEAFGVPYASSS